MLVRSITLALAALLSGPIAGAQQGASSPPATMAAAASWIRPSSVGEGRYDAEFPGGTVRSYFDGLRTVIPTLNFVDRDGSGDRQLKPLSFRAVGMRTLVSAPGESDSAILIRLSPALEVEDPTEGDAVVTLMLLSQHLSVSPVFRYFEISFPGGTITSYADALRKANPDVSIVIAPAAANLAVPPVELKNVTTTAAVKILESFYVPAKEGDFRVVVNAVRTGSGDDVVMAIGASGGDASRARRGDTTPRQRVWSIGEALDRDTKVEDILAAVELSQSLLPAQATIKYHAPSRLLIAVGTDEQLIAIDEVVNTIIRDAHNRPRSEQAPAPAQPAPR